MAAWTKDELNKIGMAEELQIETLRADGTLRKPVTIWVVRLGDNLYIRSVNGRASGWFRGVLTRHTGRIQAGGVSKNVAFVEELDRLVHEQIDSVYRKKYSHYPKTYVDACVTPQAQSATLQLEPQTAGFSSD
jgi:hypothetical protein